ncbi:MAG: hypothetical protein L0L47_03360, partial [Bifidobacterium mongoliense]|nr:hypothetical protein [Bifidobacterium mongoliense]
MSSHNTTSKGLMATIAAIALILVGVFMYYMGSMNAGRSSAGTSGGQQSTAAGAGAMKRIGILQYVTHPALDEIHRGIIDGLKQEGYVEGKNIEIFDQNGQADQ